MIFQKPKKLSYVDMCIYVDNMVQKETITDEEASLCYEYLYHIIYMLAVKQRYFHKEEYYDEFAITLAGDVFHRLFTHPKLFELDEYGKPKKRRIKSCLNYIKAILYGRKVAFEQKAYSQKYLDISDITDDYTPVATSFNYMRENLSFTPQTHLNLYLDSISKTIHLYLKTHSPYRKQPLILKNIYISCMLSILNALVLTEEDTDGLSDKYVTQEAKIRYLYRVYKENKDRCVCLYHLPPYFKNYMTVLVRQLFSVIGDEIKDLCKEDISISEDVLMNISLMEIAGRDTNDY